MDKGKFDDYLEKRYYDQIKWYSEKAAQNKNRFQTLLVVTTVFSILVPVLLFVRNDFLEVIAIVFSAIVAISTALTRSFTYQENWINYRTVSETLKKEINFYNARLGDYHDTDDPEALFVSRVENTISRENTMWVICQSSAKEKSSS